MAFLVDNIVPITLRIEDVLVFGNNVPSDISRYFTTFDPVLQTSMTMQTPKTFAGDFNLSFLVSTTSSALQKMADGLYEGEARMDLNYIASTQTLESRPYGHWLVNGVPTTHLPNDGKLRLVEFRRDATDSDRTPKVVGRLGSRIGGSIFWGGVIANVTLTDLTNPSNSESWKLDRPIGTNTEQSSSGNNLLTYVNATKRELFTKVGNDWLGVERVVNGGFDNGFDSWLAGDGWTASGGKAIGVNIDAFNKNLSQVGVFTVGLRYEISYSGVLDTGSFGLQANGGAVFVAEGDLTPTRGAVKKVWVADLTSFDVKRFTNVLNISFDNVSVKRILEVA